MASHLLSLASSNGQLGVWMKLGDADRVEEIMGKKKHKNPCVTQLATFHCDQCPLKSFFHFFVLFHC